MRLLVAVAALCVFAAIASAPAQGSTTFPDQGITVSWTTGKAPGAGSVALRCLTDEATPRFWATQQPLPLSGSWSLGTSGGETVFNYGQAYFDWTGTVSCEGRVISKNGQRIVGYTTPRFWTGLGPVTPGVLP